MKTTTTRLGKFPVAEFPFSSVHLSRAPLARSFGKFCSVHLCTLILALFLLTGCGYQLGEIRPTPMRNVRTLAVSTFENRTYRPRVEALLADTLVKRLQQDGTYRIVDESRADATLSATLVSANHYAVRSVPGDVLATAEFQLALRATYTVTERHTGRILMAGEATGVTTFFAQSDLVTVEAQAFADAAADLVGNIAVAISEGW